MVASLNKGTPMIYTLIYYNPYYGDPQKGTANLGKPPYRGGYYGDYSGGYSEFRIQPYNPLHNPI